MALAFAAALALAHAEGGLPGAPRTVIEGRQQQVVSPPAANELDPPGGAVFSPFADSAAASAARHAQAPARPDPRGPDHGVAILVAGTAIAAIAWVLSKAL